MRHTLNKICVVENLHSFSADLNCTYINTIKSPIVFNENFTINNKFVVGEIGCVILDLPLCVK